MLSIAVGGLISLVAALPSVLLLVATKHSDLGLRMRAWAIGVALRFLIILLSLIFLFRRTALNRISVLVGILLVFFLIFGIEVYFAFRRSKSQ